MTEVLMPFRVGNGLFVSPIDQPFPSKKTLSYIWANKEVFGISLPYLRCKIEPLPGHHPLAAPAYAVFFHIMNGNAASLLSQNPLCEPGENPMGECLYFFQDLCECSCPELDRKSRPELRKNYEDKIIEKIGQLFPYKDKITITVLASGFLFGELVMIVKMVYFLKEQGWNGKIDFNFIDRKYAPENALQSVAEAIKEKEEKIVRHQINLDAMKRVVCVLRNSKLITDLAVINLIKIGLSSSQNNLQKLKEEKEYLSSKQKLLSPAKEIRMKREAGSTRSASKSASSLLDFLQEAIQGSSITVKTRFFRDSNDYQMLCAIQGKFRCDLLLGSDIENMRDVISSLKDKTQIESGAGVILTKLHGNPDFIEW